MLNKTIAFPTHASKHETILNPSSYPPRLSARVLTEIYMMAIISQDEVRTQIRLKIMETLLHS